MSNSNRGLYMIFTCLFCLIISMVGGIVWGNVCTDGTLNIDDWDWNRCIGLTPADESDNNDNDNDNNNSNNNTFISSDDCKSLGTGKHFTCTKNSPKNSDTLFRKVDEDGNVQAYASDAIKKTWVPDGSSIMNFPDCEGVTLERNNIRLPPIGEPIKCKTGDPKGHSWPNEQIYRVMGTQTISHYPSHGTAGNKDPDWQDTVINVDCTDLMLGADVQ